MVSNAREDLPEPLTPVTTVMRLIGIENEMFLRLLTRAPRTSIASWVMIGACKNTQRGIRRLSQTPHLNSKNAAKRRREWVGWRSFSCEVAGIRFRQNSDHTRIAR